MTPTPEQIAKFTTVEISRLRDWQLGPPDEIKKHSDSSYTLVFRPEIPFRSEVIFFTDNVRVTGMFVGVKIVFGVLPDYPVPEKRPFPPSSIVIESDVEKAPVCLLGQTIRISIETLDNEKWDVQIFGTCAT